MATLAFRDIDRPAAHRICGAIKLGNVAGAEPRDALIGRHTGGQEFDVGDEGPQLRRVGRQGATVQAAGHTGIDPIFDADLGARPRAVFWEVAIETEDRQAKSFCSSLKVTIAAGKIVAGIALCRIAHLRPDMRVSCGDEIAARRTRRP